MTIKAEMKMTRSDIRNSLTARAMKELAERQYKRDKDKQVVESIYLCFRKSFMDTFPEIRAANWKEIDGFRVDYWDLPQAIDKELHALAEKFYDNLREVAAEND